MQTKPKEKKDKKSPKNKLITISIEPNKKHKQKDKKITIISWDHNYNPFPEYNLKEISSDLANEFSTSCSIKDCSFQLLGSFIRSKNYLVENYGLDKNQFRIEIKTSIILPIFHVKFHTKKGTNFINISWPKMVWTDEDYVVFCDDFKLRLLESKKKFECNETNNNIEYKVQGGCVPFFTKFLKDKWRFEDNQIIIEEEPRDKEEKNINPENQNYLIHHSYSKMIDKFNDFNYDNTYYRKMSETIQDAYKMDLNKLERIKIKTNLKFEKSVRKNDENKDKDKTKDKDDKEAEDYWTTKFNVLSRFSIDGIQNGRFLFNGDEVIVNYKERNGTIKGKIISNVKGDITALFELKEGILPPGVKASEEEEEEEIRKEDEDGAKKVTKKHDDDDDDDVTKKVAKKHDDDDDDDAEEECYDDDDNDDIEEYYPNDDYAEEEEDDDEKNPYTITFKPNMSIYEKYAFGLLALESMESCPIKEIMVSEKFDRTKNEIKNVDVDIKDRMEFDPESLLRLTKEEREKITRPLTPSQKECVEMILKNHISVVHGPPGCGKTYSIGLFVYHLLKQSQHTKKRILLCAYSNQAVESIVSHVSPIAKALNKKIVWLSKTFASFDKEEDFIKATEEQKCLSIYQIMKRKETEEVFQYKELQKKKWNSEEIKNVKKKKSKQIKTEKFTNYDQSQMINYQYIIEKNLVNESDIVCCSIAASGRWNLKCFNFDYVIIDEASQADQMTSLIPFIHYPSKIILLGDHNQLDANVLSELKQSHPSTTQSLYLKLHNDKIQHKMLKTQFRMNPSICEFPNKAFYQGNILTADFLKSKAKDKLKGIPLPIAFIDVKDGFEKKVYGLTYKNKREAIVIERLLKNFKRNGILGTQIGVIAPYHGQVEILRDVLKRIDYKDVRLSSVDHFQGCERDYIIISMVRTSKSGHFGFITDKHRLNVSLTRARKGLIIVGRFDRLSTKNREVQIPENEILIQLCQFYKSNKKVFESNKIKEIEKKVKKEEEEVDDDDDFYNENVNQTSVDQIPEIVNDDNNDFGEEYDIEDDCTHYDDLKDLIK